MFTGEVKAVGKKALKMGPKTPQMLSKHWVNGWTKGKTRFKKLSKAK